MGKIRVAAYIGTAVNADSNIHVEYIKAEVSKHTDWELVEIYLDKGAIGRDRRRPMFSKMIEDGKAKKFDYVVCRSIAKFSREAKIAFELINELKESGVGAYFIEENVDTLSKDYATYESAMLEASRVGKIISEQQRKYEAEHPELFPDEED